MTEREKREIQAQKALARAEVERLRVLRERDLTLKKSRIDATKAARKAEKERRATEREIAKLHGAAEKLAERERVRAEREEYKRKEEAKTFSELLNDVHERYETPVLARDSKGRYLSIKKAKEAKEAERDASIRAIAERFGIPRNEVWHQYFSPSFK